VGLDLDDERVVAPFSVNNDGARRDSRRLCDDREAAVSTAGENCPPERRRSASRPTFLGERVYGDGQTAIGEDGQEDPVRQVA
jgi:hypothetical protein